MFSQTFSVLGVQVSGWLLHHMQTAEDIQEFSAGAKTFRCNKLLSKLEEIRADAPWVAPIPLASPAPALLLLRPLLGATHGFLFHSWSQDNPVMRKVVAEGLSSLTIAEVSALLVCVGMGAFVDAFAEEEVSYEFCKGTNF